MKVKAGFFLAGVYWLWYEHIPKAPDKFYKGQGWISWSHFLGKD